MSKFASKIVVLILGALVLVGCAKQGEVAAWERPRMAGEVLDAVATQSGDLVGIPCINQLMQDEAKGTGPTVTSEMIKKECGQKTSAVSKTSVATMGRNRLFYDASVTLRGYYYLPYYINYNYTTTDYGTSANDICKWILGTSCKKAKKWAYDYFEYDYTVNYQTYNQSYQPGCYSYLQYNYQNYGYGYSGYNSGNSTGNGSGYNSGLSNSFYYNPSTWNNSWYNCYNVYY